MERKDVVKRTEGSWREWVKSKTWGAARKTDQVVGFWSSHDCILDSLHSTSTELILSQSISSSWQLAQDRDGRSLRKVIVHIPPPWGNICISSKRPTGFFRYFSYHISCLTRFFVSFCFENCWSLNSFLKEGYLPKKLPFQYSENVSSYFGLEIFHHLEEITYAVVSFEIS